MLLMRVLTVVRAQASKNYTSIIVHLLEKDMNRDLYQV